MLHKSKICEAYSCPVGAQHCALRAKRVLGVLGVWVTQEGAKTPFAVHHTLCVYTQILGTKGAKQA